MAGLHQVRDVNIETAVAAVRSLINSADRSAEALARHEYGEDWMYSHSVSKDVGTAFTQLMMLTDALGLTQTYLAIGRGAVPVASVGERFLGFRIVANDRGLAIGLE